MCQEGKGQQTHAHAVIRLVGEGAAAVCFSTDCATREIENMRATAPNPFFLPPTRLPIIMQRTSTNNCCSSSRDLEATDAGMAPRARGAGDAAIGGWGALQLQLTRRPGAEKNVRSRPDARGVQKSGGSRPAKEKVVRAYVVFRATPRNSFFVTSPHPLCRARDSTTHLTHHVLARVWRHTGAADQCRARRAQTDGRDKVCGMKRAHVLRPRPPRPARPACQIQRGGQALGLLTQNPPHPTQRRPAQNRQPHAALALRVRSRPGHRHHRPRREAGQDGERGQVKREFRG